MQVYEIQRLTLGTFLDFTVLYIEAESLVEPGTSVFC